MPRADVTIGGTVKSHLVDTGAAINVLDQTSFERLRFKPRLEKCSTNYYAFSSASPISVIGQFSAQVSFKGKSVIADYIVVNGNADCLLSFHTANQLGIISMLNALSPQ